MALQYGFGRCKLSSSPQLKASRQYHLHASPWPGDVFDLVLVVEIDATAASSVERVKQPF